MFLIKRFTMASRVGRAFAVASAIALGACNGDSSSSGDRVAQSPTESDVVQPESQGMPSFNAAFRLARQATFGADARTLADIRQRGIEGWIDHQFAMRSAYDSATDTHKTHLERLRTMAVAVEPETDWFPQELQTLSGLPLFNGAASRHTLDYQNSIWFENALDGPDQLRQRVAYALSQLMVVSHTEFPLNARPEALAHYYDVLAKHAFGNFRALLGAVARSPAMGIYLSHQGNHKANRARNTLPDENFARELMQLFTIGLYELNPDGTPRTDASGQLIPTYTQSDIEELSRVMTGWDLQFNSRYGRLWQNEGSLVHPMEFNTDEHDFGEKLLLGQVIPANMPAGRDLDAALDILFAHPNAAPFVSKHLIQRLVTSNPTPDYVRRVAAVFADNGDGVRGDLRATVKAILLDDEARSAAAANADDYGKVVEPLLALTGVLRAMDVSPLNGWFNDQLDSTDPAKVEGFYFFRSDHRWELGQAALRSPSVFNFYSPDFVPQDDFYNSGRDDAPLVLPEMQLRTPANIAGFQNLLLPGKRLLEKTWIAQEHGSLNAYVNAQERWLDQRMLALVDYGPLLAVFERHVDGDTDGDFENIDASTTNAQGLTPKQAGIDAVLKALEHNLRGQIPLPEPLRSELLGLLDRGAYFDDSGVTAREEALRVVSGGVLYVALSADTLAQQ